MRTMIVKEFRFEAAHRLPNHDGHCARLHGHSYRVQVAIVGDPSRESGHAKEGMVVDFADVSVVWKDKLHPMLDHRDLNETIGQEVGVTTAENIAAWIWERMGLHLNTVEGGRDVIVSGVRVWETATGYAQVGTL